MRGTSRTGILSATCLALLLGASDSRASGPVGFAGGGCDSCGKCAMQLCPKPFKWYSEGGPRICFKSACPRPVCNPCTLEHFGYFATCWNPWPYPPNWSHCPTPPSGAVLPPPSHPPYAPKRPAGTTYAPVMTAPAGELPAPSSPPRPANVPSVRIVP